MWPASFGALALLAAAVAVRSELPRTPVWLAAGMAGSAALAPYVKDALSRAHERYTAQRKLLTQHFLVNARGEPHRVRDLADPLRLGVHRAADLADADATTRLHLLGLPERVPLYVPRDCDATVDRALAAGGLVLLEGPSASGKSRTAYEAMRRCLPDRILLVPNAAGSLRELVDSGYELRDAVIWLDDLERFLGPSGLDIHLLHRICPPMGDRKTWSSSPPCVQRSAGTSS